MKDRVVPRFMLDALDAPRRVGANDTQGRVAQSNGPRTGQRSYSRNADSRADHFSADARDWFGRGHRRFTSASRHPDPGTNPLADSYAPRHARRGDLPDAVNRASPHVL